MKYSPSTNGFYTEASHGKNIPRDCIEIENDLYYELVKGKQGHKIKMVGGLPALVCMTDQLTIKKKNLECELSQHLNYIATTFGYDDANSIAKYLGYDNCYRQECEEIGRFIAQSWNIFYSMEDENFDSLTFDELKSKLPTITIGNS